MWGFLRSYYLFVKILLCLNNLSFNAAVQTTFDFADNFISPIFADDIVFIICDSNVVLFNQSKKNADSTISPVRCAADIIIYFGGVYR